MPGEALEIDLDAEGRPPGCGWRLETGAAPTTVDVALTDRLSRSTSPGSPRRRWSTWRRSARHAGVGAHAPRRRGPPGKCGRGRHVRRAVPVRPREL